MRQQPEPAPREAFPPVSRAGWTILAALLVLGGVFRGARLAEAPGGFLVFNEGFYINLARRTAGAGVLDWFFKPLDYNNPPLYSAILATLYRVHAPEVATGRLISVVAGLGTIVVTFLLGRLLFDERTGLVAAAMLAVMPGAVIVDHNLQVDSLFVFLLFSSVYFYVLAIRSSRNLHALLGGALLGLSILTKQPALLALPALAVWETWRTRGLKWILTRRALTFGAAALVLGLSWYAWQVAFAAPAFFGAEGGVAARSSWRDADLFFWTTVFGRELLWMVFPLSALAVLAGLAFAAWKRKVGDKLLLVFAVTYTLYYVQFHFHSYYLLPLAPLFALAVGRVVMGAGRAEERQGWRIAVVVVLAAGMCFGTFTMMADKKWGQWSPLALEAPSTASAAPWLYVTPHARGFFGPALGLVDGGRGQKDLSAVEFLSLPAAETSRAVLLYDGIVVNRFGVQSLPSYVAMDVSYRPVLFGYRIDVARRTATTGTQYFANPGWVAVQVGPPWDFRIARTVTESGWYLYNNRSFGR